MVGMGSLEHLRLLVNESSDNEYRRDLWNGTDFRIHDRVFIQFNGEKDVSPVRQGPLTVGYGADDHRFGPELGLGWQVAELLKNEDIVLVKAAWGGRSLAIDFRPPLSGEGNYSGVKPSYYGWTYRDMIRTIHYGLDHMADYYPRFNATEGYEIAGMIWFQGWNDMCDPPLVPEYGWNLANFIRDVRREFDLPQLPFVIGELGMHGDLRNHTEPWVPRVQTFRAMQKGVTLMSEFRNNTIFVPTTPYVVNNGTTYNGQYHYNGRADTCYHIGKALGRGVVQLLMRQQKTLVASSTTAATK